MNFQSSIGQSSNRWVVRLFFGTGIVVSLASGASLLFFPRTLSSENQIFLVTVCLSLATIFAGCAWRWRDARLADAVLLSAWSTVISIVLIDFGLGTGVHELGLGYFAVLVFV